jgi:hypothetical protein
MNKHPCYSIGIENGALIILTLCPWTKNVEVNCKLIAKKHKIIGFNSVVDTDD